MKPTATYGIGTPSMLRVMTVSVGVSVAATLPAFLLGALSVRLRSDLGVSLASIGLAIAIGRGSGALMAGPLGRLTDRLGPTRAMRTSAAIAAASALGIVAFAEHWLVVFVVVAIGGAAAPLAQASANLSLMGGDRPGLAFGLKQSALPIASIIAGVSVPVIALTVGWRWTFAMSAVFAGLIGISVPAFRPAPEKARDDLQARHEAHASRRPLIVLATGLMLGATASSALSAFTVESAVDVGFSEAVAGLMLTAGSLIAVGVRLGLGAYADRRDAGHLRIVAWMVGISAAGYLILSLGSIWSFVVGGFVAFALGWGYAGLFWFSIVQLGASAPGRATGLVLPGGMIGAMSGPIVFGWVAESMGHAAAWFVMAILSALGALIIGLGQRFAVET